MCRWSRRSFCLDDFRPCPRSVFQRVRDRRRGARRRRPAVRDRRRRRVSRNRIPSLVKDAVGASHGNFARIRELVEKQPAHGARLDRLGLRRLGNVHRRRRARRQQADRRLPADQRRAADDLFGGDDGPARCGEGVHRGAAGHPEDARPARHHVDVAREGRRTRCRRGRAVPRVARRCGHADADAAAGAGRSRCDRRQVRLRSRTARLLHDRRAAGFSSTRLASASIARTARRAAS